jgi:hypothetical protein
MAAKVGINDLVKSAILSVNSTEATHNVELIKNNSPTNKYRTTGITGEYIIFDHGTAKALSGIYIDGANMESGDTVYTFKSGTTTACTDGYSAALTKATKSYHELLTWTTPYRYNRIDITGASGTYREIGKVFIFQDLYTFDLDWEENYGDGINPFISESIGFAGQQNVTFRATAQTKNLPFRGIGDTQRDLLIETLMSKNPIEQGVIFYDHVRTEAFLGKIISTGATHVFLNNWNVNSAFVEFK